MYELFTISDTPYIVCNFQYWLFIKIKAEYKIEVNEWLTISDTLFVVSSTTEVQLEYEIEVNEWFVIFGTAWT